MSYEDVLVYTRMDLSNSYGQLNSKPFNSIGLTLNSKPLGVNYGCADLI